MQTKKQSLIESLINVAVGYGISLLSLSIILPLMGIVSSPGKNLQITLYFTVISIFRSYLLRRYFNRKTSFSFSWSKFHDKMEPWGKAAAQAIRR